MTNFFHSEDSQQSAADREIRERFLDASKGIDVAVARPLIEGLTAPSDERSKKLKLLWDAMPVRVRRQIV